MTQEAREVCPKQIGGDTPTPQPTGRQKSEKIAQLLLQQSDSYKTSFHENYNFSIVD